MFSVGDRVIRTKGGCYGTVVLCKKEIWGTEQEKIDSMMYKVAWDSGIESYVSKEQIITVADYNEHLTGFIFGLNRIQ